MKRLTIHLKKFEPTIGQIKNTLSFKVKNEKETKHHLSMHEGNVKKHYLTNL